MQLVETFQEMAVNPAFDDENGKLNLLAFVLLLLGIVILLLQVCALFPYTEGDTFLHYTFARNIAQGHWLEFNVGEPSLGSTSPLWSLLLGILYKVVGQDNIIVGSKLLSIASAGLSAYLVFYIGRHLLNNPLIGVIGAFWYTINPLVAFWAVTAMETMMFVVFTLLCLILGAKVLQTRTVSWSRSAGLGIICGLTVLTRPEGAMFVAIVCVAMLISGHSAIRVCLYKISVVLITALLTISPYLLLALLKTGTIVLVSGRSRLFFARYLTYEVYERFWNDEAFRNLFSTNGFLSFLVLCGTIYICLKSNKANRNYLMVVAIGWSVFSLLFFSFFIPITYGGRYTLSIWPFFYLIAALGLWYIATDVRAVLANKADITSFVVLLVVWSLVLGLRSHLNDLDKKIHLVDSHAYSLAGHPRLSLWIKNNTTEDDLVLTYVSQIAFYSERRILSLDGIIDGKVFPYLHSKNGLKEFLCTFRPALLAGNAPQNTFFERAWKIPRFSSNSSVGDTIELNEIRFELIDIVEETSGVKHPVYKIDYSSCGVD